MKSRILASVLFLLANRCYAEQQSELTHVSLDQATRQVLGIAKNTVLGATTEMIEGKEVHIIKVLDANGWIRFYKIDAETGAQLS